MKRFAKLILMSVSGPTAGLLFFVWAKKSNQKKAHPVAALILRSVVFVGGCQKGHPWPSGNGRHPCRPPKGLIPSKAAVLGGVREQRRLRRKLRYAGGHKLLFYN